MYLATYELPDGSWQSLAQFETYDEAEETMIFHAGDGRWVVIHESQKWVLESLKILVE